MAFLLLGSDLVHSCYYKEKPRKEIKGVEDKRRTYSGNSILENDTEIKFEGFET